VPKKTTKKTTPGSSAKKSTKKPVSKKAPVKKVTKAPAAKKKPLTQTTKKPTTKKPTTKKPAAKKTTKATTKKTPVTNKPVVKKTTKPVTKKPVVKKTTKAVTSKKTPPKAEPKVTRVVVASAADSKKVNRKGITIVAKKTMRRKVTPKPITTFQTMGGTLLGKRRKPMIVSGPKAAPAENTFVELDDEAKKKLKTPFNKRQLDSYKAILLNKLDELAGDVHRMEKEALQGESGASSKLPQHLAEQGSDAYDQMLSLDLAAADREIITEIIDALKRITAKTFGLCELTGKAISLERLEELPWARYSIDAAREMERRTQYQ